MLNKAQVRTTELKEMVKKKELNEGVSLCTSVVLLTIIWLARIERERGDRVLGCYGKGLSPHSHKTQGNFKTRGSKASQEMLCTLILFIFVNDL